MIRLTWLQSRTQTIVAAGGLAIAAAFLAATGPHLVQLYNDIVANCSANHDCGVATDVFLRHDATLRTWLDGLVLAVPGLVGVFWGAPLVARELESGTHRLVWTQSVTRGRWMAVKLGVLGLTAMAVAGLLSFVVTWWASPLDRGHAVRFTTFDMRDVAPVAYAAFAFALAVALGIVIRRTLPAMATALAAFVAVRLAVLHWVRPHLLVATHTLLPLSAAHRVGFIGSGSGATFVAGDPGINNALIVSSKIADKAGHPASAEALHHYFHTACPILATHVGHLSGRGQRPPDPRLFDECLRSFAAKFDLAAVYQPSSHYWPLQWGEFGIFLAAGLALAAFSFRWVCRRHV
jgi:hypothetical protein